MRIEKISSRQIIFLIIISRITTAISFMPTIHKPPANQDIWLMNIISIFYILIVFFPVLFLTKKFSGLSIIEYMEKIFGKVLGKIIGIFYGLFFAFETIFIINIQTLVVGSTLLTDESNFVIISIITVVCIYIATRGLEVIGRTSEIFGPIIVTVITVMLITGYKNVDFSLLLPIYKDSTFLALNQGAVEMAFLFSPIAILAMIGPNLENKNELNSIFLKSIIVSVLLVIITVVFSQGTLGIEQAKHANFPFLIYARLIFAYGVAERIESFYVATWIFANIARVTGFLYISSRAFREVLGRKEEKIFTAAIGIIIGIISLYTSRKKLLLGAGSSIESLSNTLSLVFLILIPFIAMIVYFFRRKSLEKEEKLQS